jgi:hypothetical protein
MPTPEPIAAEREIPARAVLSTSCDDSPQEEVWTAATCPIELPVGLDAGEFRVVDDTGRVARLVLTAAVPATNAGDRPGSAEVLAKTVDSRRWYFIRLQASVATNSLDCDREASTTIPPAIADANPVRTACANRKFDFTGFEAPASSDAAADDFRPEPPALPETPEIE